jgi:hypothetical protein
MTDLLPKSSSVDKVALLDVGAVLAAKAVVKPLLLLDDGGKKPVTAAKARQKADAEVNAMRKASANTLHFVLKCCVDEDHVGNMREDCLATKAELVDHSHYTSQVKDDVETRKYMCDMAHYSYLDTQRRMLATLSDVKALSRCGHLCDPALAEEIDLSSSLLDIEDSRAQRYLAKVINILRHRTSSMGWHTSGYPGVLAGLLHADENKRATCLARIKKHFDAVAWCMEGCAESRNMAERSLIKTGKLVDWVVRKLVDVAWERIPDDVAEFVSNLFSGYLQTVINERYNQLIRDMELRNNPSKYGSCMSMWFKLLNATMIEDYGRHSVRPPHSESAVPGDIDVKCLFEPVKHEMDVNLKLLNGKATWQTWTSQTIKRAYHEQELMVKAFDAGDRSMIAKSWRTSFLPSGEVIIVRGKGIVTRAFIVLWNVGGVCGAWPIARHDTHIEIMLDCEVGRGFFVC